MGRRVLDRAGGNAAALGTAVLDGLGRGLGLELLFGRSRGETRGVRARGAQARAGRQAPAWAWGAPGFLLLEPARESQPAPGSRPARGWPRPAGRPGRAGPALLATGTGPPAGPWRRPARWWRPRPRRRWPAPLRPERQVLAASWLPRCPLDSPGRTRNVRATLPRHYAATGEGLFKTKGKGHDSLLTVIPAPEPESRGGGAPAIPSRSPACHSEPLPRLSFRAAPPPVIPSRRRGISGPPV